MAAVERAERRQFDHDSFRIRLGSTTTAPRTSAACRSTGCCAAGWRLRPSATRSSWWVPPRLAPGRAPNVGERGGVHVRRRDSVQRDSRCCATSLREVPTWTAIALILLLGPSARCSRCASAPSAPPSPHSASWRSTRPSSSSCSTRAASSPSPIRAVARARRGGGLAAGLVVNAFEKERVRDLFSRFVPSRSWTRCSRTWTRICG